MLGNALKLAARNTPNIVSGMRLGVRNFPSNQADNVFDTAIDTMTDDALLRVIVRNRKLREAVLETAINNRRIRNAIRRAAGAGDPSARRLARMMDKAPRKYNRPFQAAARMNPIRVCARNPMACAGSAGLGYMLYRDHVDKTEAYKVCTALCMPKNYDEVMWDENPDDDFVNGNGCPDANAVTSNNENVPCATRPSHNFIYKTPNDYAQPPHAMEVFDAPPDDNQPFCDANTLPRLPEFTRKSECEASIGGCFNGELVETFTPTQGWNSEATGWTFPSGTTAVPLDNPTDLPDCLSFCAEECGRLHESIFQKVWEKGREIFTNFIPNVMDLFTNAGECLLDPLECVMPIVYALGIIIVGVILLTLIFKQLAKLG